MPGTLFVHIGSPKTGSTALQNFLFEKRSELANAELLQPVRDLHPGKGQEGLRASLFRKESDDTLEWRRYYQDFFGALRSGKMGFVGTEMLWTVNPERLSEVYPELQNLEIVTLAVVRRQSEMLPTHYKQYIMSGGTDDFSSFFANRAEYYNYTKLLSNWRRISQVVTLRYSIAQRTGTIRCIMDEVIRRATSEQQLRISSAIKAYEPNGIRWSNQSILNSQAVAIRAISRLNLSGSDSLALRNAILRSRSEFEAVSLEHSLVTLDELESLVLPLERDDEELFIAEGEPSSQEPPQIPPKS